MSADEAIWFAGTFFSRREDGQVEANPVGGSPRETFTPDEFRERLALLGRRLADRAQDGPDPGEVEELARALHEGRERNDGQPGEWDRQAARTALQWMRDREAGS